MNCTMFSKTKITYGYQQWSIVELDPKTQVIANLKTRFILWLCAANDKHPVERLNINNEPI